MPKGLFGNTGEVESSNSNQTYLKIALESWITESGKRCEGGYSGGFYRGNEGYDGCKSVAAPFKTQKTQ